MQKFHHDMIAPLTAPLQICENAHQVSRIVFLVLLSAYSRDPYTDFYAQYVK